MLHKGLAKSVSHTEVLSGYPEKELSTLKVLVVEDDPLTQFIHQKTFKFLNCMVDVADNAEDALKFLHSYYDLIITDLNLPGMNGITFTKTVRKMTSYQNIPIVAVTSLADPLTHSICIQAGVNKVLIKPARVEALCEIVMNTKKGYTV